MDCARGWRTEACMGKKNPPGTRWATLRGEGEMQGKLVQAAFLHFRVVHDCLQRGPPNGGFRGDRNQLIPCSSDLGKEVHPLADQHMPQVVVIHNALNHWCPFRMNGHLMTSGFLRYVFSWLTDTWRRRLHASISCIPSNCRSCCTCSTSRCEP